MDESQNKVDMMQRSGSTSEYISTFRNIQNSAAINSELNKSPEKLVAIDSKKHCQTKKHMKESDGVPTKQKGRSKFEKQIKTL